MVGTKQSNFFDQFDNQNVNFYELAFLLLPFVREKKTILPTILPLWLHV